MVDTNYRKSVPDNYFGRSPYDEFYYNRTPTDMKNTDGTPMVLGSVPFKFMRDQNNPLKNKNRNFSALNYAPINDKNYSAIYGNSSDPRKRNNLLTTPNSTGNNRPNTYVNPSNRLAKPIGTNTGTGGTPTPPNFRNNLLNYLVSPQGKGMAQGLLEASGYSKTPVSFGQALSRGMQRSNEAQAQAQASQLARDKFNYQKEQDILNRSLEYAKIKPASVPALQQNIRTMLEARNLKPGTPEYDIAFAGEIEKYLAKSNSSTTTINMPEDKGDVKVYELAATSFDNSGQELQKTTNIAITQNTNIENMMRLIRNLDEGDFGTFGGLKLQLQQMAKQLGVNTDDLSDKEAFFTLAGDFVMSQIAKTKGAISNKEMAYFEMISPGLSRSKQGNILQLQLAKAVNQFNIDIMKKRTQFELDAAKRGLNSVEMKNEWNQMYMDIIQKDNSILGTLEKKMENNIINTAIEDLGAENLLFNVRNEKDLDQVKTQINTYYDNFGETPQDYKLVGYTQEGHPQIMVDLGNDRYELRTVTTDMRN